MFEAFPLWAQARSGRNSALFHVEHFPIRLQFPKCSTWNNTLHHPSNSDPQTRLLPSIRSEKLNPPPLEADPWPDRPRLLRAASIHTCRHIVQTEPTLAATTLVSVSGLSSNTTTTPPADSQLAPPGSLTRPSLSPSAGVLASIGRTFLGLNHPKTHQRMPLFHHSLQRQPHRPFQAYPAKCPAHRGTSVDKIVSTASGAGNSSARVAPANRTALAAFLKAAD